MDNSVPTYSRFRLSHSCPDELRQLFFAHFRQAGCGGVLWQTTIVDYHINTKLLIFPVQCRHWRLLLEPRTPTRTYQTIQRRVFHSSTLLEFVHAMTSYQSGLQRYLPYPTHSRFLVVSLLAHCVVIPGKHGPDLSDSGKSAIELQNMTHMMYWYGDHEQMKGNQDIYLHNNDNESNNESNNNQQRGLWSPARPHSRQWRPCRISVLLWR